MTNQIENRTSYETDIKYSSHPAMFRQFPILFIVLWVLLLSSIILPFVWAPVLSIALGIFVLCIIKLVVWTIDILATKVVVTNNSVKVFNGILSKDVTQIYIQDITKYRSHQTLFQRIMRTGDIEISSSASSVTEIDVKGLPSPSKIFTAIHSRR